MFQKLRRPGDQMTPHKIYGWLPNLPEPAGLFPEALVVGDGNDSPYRGTQRFAEAQDPLPL